MASTRIEQGLVSGTDNDGVAAFLGIPYAAPPVGERRWAPPAPPTAWDGVRDATTFGNAAVQTVGTGSGLRAEQSEDCLYLNVWTTTVDPTAHQPVMLWVHGGGFLNGAASMTHWTGEKLARHGVTVVSINYRLGAFGFLAHPDTGTNFAVLDWVTALAWVSKNIAAFGGDPDNVTVFGQSAGGAAVRALLSTPTARGLFHRGIIQSAGFEDCAAIASPSLHRITQHSDALCDRLGSHDITVLRQAPAEAVQAASRAEAGLIPPPGQVHTPANLVWYPTVDGDIVTDDFADWPTDVPVMFGCTQDEARAFCRPAGIYGRPDLAADDLYTPATLGHMARALGGDRAADILAHFATRDLAPYESLAELTTAAVWLEPALATYDRFADLDRTTYHYRFARISPAARRTGLLAYHSAEIPYIFGSVTPHGQWDAMGLTPAETQTADRGEVNFDEVDVTVSEAVQHAWVEFARTGVPCDLDGTPWPTCDRTDPRFALIGDTVEAAPLDVSPIIEMINSLRDQPHKA